jgi:hypothetical protein
MTKENQKWEMFLKSFWFDRPFLLPRAFDSGSYLFWSLNQESTSHHGPPCLNLWFQPGIKPCHIYYPNIFGNQYFLSTPEIVLLAEILIIACLDFPVAFWMAFKPLLPYLCSFKMVCRFQILSQTLSAQNVMSCLPSMTHMGHHIMVFDQLSNLPFCSSLLSVKVMGKLCSCHL